VADATLASALAEFQRELPRLGKGQTANTGTYSYRYADLADVSTVVLPLLAKHGLSFSAKPTLDESGRFVLEYTLRHSGGESDTGRYPLANGTPQQIGSSITYARRYALCSVTGIAPDEDDDGAQAPPPSDEPVETTDQAVRADEFAEEIGHAETAEAIEEIGGRVRQARTAGRITPTQYTRLARAASAQLAKVPKPEPEAVA
jgi:hypothetical protein